MSSKMLQLLQERISSGLKKKAIKRPSEWATAHRMMNSGPWRFDHYPWLLDMHDSNAESNVGQKAAQMGYTETMLNLTFYNIDILRRDCLYVLPAKTPDAHDFSASRFDPALELSEYLTKLFSDVQNIGHKRAGSVNLYVRGSKSRSGLKSLPAGFLVLDEVDEMVQEHIPLAEERQSGQLTKQTWKISTPTFEGMGINKLFRETTMEHFFFKCPHCSKQIELKWPESVVMTSDHPNHPDLQNTYYICYECKNTLSHEKKHEYLCTGHWVPQRTDTNIRGFYINQLYSYTVKPSAIAKLYLDSLVDQAAEQEFFNSKLGLTHAVKGARITDEVLDKCIGGFKTHREGLYRSNKVITMGIDVGRWLHWVIYEWAIPADTPYNDVNSYAVPRIIAFGKVPDFHSLDSLIYQYGVHFTVIDANPERRLAFAFVQKHYGRAKMCLYTRGVSGRQTVPSPESDQAVNVDRTAWLDMSLGRFHRGKDKGINLPIDIDLEFRENLKAQIRQYLRDADGNPIGKYLTADNTPDHYGHACNYAEIALTFALGAGEAEDIDNPI